MDMNIVYYLIAGIAAWSWYKRGATVSQLTQENEKLANENKSLQAKPVIPAASTSDALVKTIVASEQRVLSTLSSLASAINVVSAQSTATAKQVAKTNPVVGTLTAKKSTTSAKKARKSFVEGAYLTSYISDAAKKDLVASYLTHAKKDLKHSWKGAEVIAKRVSLPESVVKSVLTQLVSANKIKTRTGKETGKSYYKVA